MAMDWDKCLDMFSAFVLVFIGLSVVGINSENSGTSGKQLTIFWRQLSMFVVQTGPTRCNWSKCMWQTVENIGCLYEMVIGWTLMRLNKIETEIALQLLIR